MIVRICIKLEVVSLGPEMGSGLMCVQGGPMGIMNYNALSGPLDIQPEHLIKVHTDKNLADAFTKALPRGKVSEHANGIGLRLASSFMHIYARELKSTIDTTNVEPFKILDRRLQKKGNAATVYVLVQWANGTADDATWEWIEDLQRRFPQFLADA
ncbi:putative retrotransposon protein [Tanacetum coccineum]